MTGSGGTSYNITGADVLLGKVQGLSAELRTMVNRELRAASKTIAADAARTVHGRGRGAPQARDVSTTARPKNDRLPVVRIPGVRPPLSGIRRGAGRNTWQAVARAATGGGTGRQFTGTRNWVYDLRADLARIGADRWTTATADTLKRWGLI